MADEAAVAALLSEGMALWSRYQVEGGVELETRAVELTAEALARVERSGERALRGVCEVNLGLMLVARYGRTGSADDLDVGAGHLDAALALLPPGHEDVPQALNTAAMASCHRFQRSGGLGHLARAVELAREGVRAGSNGTDPRAVGWHSNLGLVLRLQYECTGDEAALDEAIVQGRRAAQLASADQRPLIMGALIGSLLQRVVRRQERADVEEAVSVARGALSALSVMPGYPARAQVLGAVVAALRADHQFLGHRRSLAEAITLQRRVVDALPATSPDRAIHLGNLSEVLRLRFEQLGSRDDLEEAAEAARQARECAGAAAFSGALAAIASTAQRPLALARLADGDRQAAAVAAEESAAAAREAGRLAGTPDRLARALVLEAGACLAQHEVTGEASARERAVACFERAAGLLSADDPARGVLLSNAAVNRLNALPDDAGTDLLSPVIEQLREAVAITGSDTADGAQSIANLGAALTRRYAAARDRADLDEADALWGVLAGLDAAPPQQRVRGAALAGELLMTAGDFSGAAERYAAAVALLPRAAWHGADRASLEAGLAEARHVSSDAAASRLAADGDAEAALLLLESGRGVLWTRTLQLRQGTSALQQWDPELADRMADIAFRLDSLQSGPDRAPHGSDSRHNDLREALAQEYQALADRAVAAGHGDFLAPPGREELLISAEDGPVVVVNVSRWRCDALIVTRAGVHLYTYRPAELTAAQAERRAADYLAALRRVDDARSALHRTTQERRANHGLAAVRAEAAARADVLEATRAADTVLGRTLTWLWDAVAAPVVRELDRLGLPADRGARDAAAPRLWWCPTGALALLPLHAAGRHDADPAVGDALLDRFACSTTPTVRALARARRGTPPHPADTAPPARMLVVALPAVPGQPPLPQVQQELDHLRSLLPGDRITVLEGSRATREAVRTELARHPWAHVSCHGTQQLGNPSAGGLLLCDGLLTVAEISAGRHRGDFILLSACKTATGGHELSEEAISLGAALHFTGYRHVIGTLWSVDARAAAEFSRTVHAALATTAGFDPARSAEAVRAAALRLRADPRLPRFSWVPFTHIGP